MSTEPIRFIILMAKCISCTLADGQRILPADMHQTHQEDINPALVKNQDPGIAVLAVAFRPDQRFLQFTARVTDITPPLVMSALKFPLEQEAIVEEQRAATEEGRAGSKRLRG